MKKAGFFLVFILAAVCAFPQSRYLPLGVNGISLGISSGFSAGKGMDQFSVETGYSLGGRMDLSIGGGFVVEDIDGVATLIPDFRLHFGLAILKQNKGIPLSLVVGMGWGFAIAEANGRSISGNEYRFDGIVSYDLPLDSLFLGFNVICEYHRSMFDATSPDTTTQVNRLLVGPGFDIGLRFRKGNGNLGTLRTDLLWDADGHFHFRLNAYFIFIRKY